MEMSAAPEGGAAAGPGDSVLEEEIDPDYEPLDGEIKEYAEWLGMDLEMDSDLFWIAKEALKAPLPEAWKPCRTADTEDIYYFNFSSGESTWNHPCDDIYRKLYEEEKRKKLRSNTAKEANQDVAQLLSEDAKTKMRNSSSGSASGATAKL
jgi:centrosomal protein CEP164